MRQYGRVFTEERRKEGKHIVFTGTAIYERGIFMHVRGKAFFVFLALVFAFALLPAAHAQPLARGVNLGNMLEAPAEGAWGERFEDGYAKIMRDAGFDHVRLPVMWSIYAANDAPYALAPDILSRVDHVVDVLLKQGLGVILDFHNYEALTENPEGETEKFLAIWRQLSRHYAAYSEALGFELLNEPGMSRESWNGLVAKALPILREENPTRLVLVSGVNWGGGAALFDLILPGDDPNLMGTFHLYQPFAFTHQGADWVGEESQNWLGTRWQGTVYDRSEIRCNLALARAWSEDTGLPVHLGEFGAYDKADHASRVRWTEYVARQAEKSGISWSYWEFCANFGIYDNDAARMDGELLKALMP